MEGQVEPEEMEYDDRQEDWKTVAAEEIGKFVDQQVKSEEQGKFYTKKSTKATIARKLSKGQEKSNE